MAMRSFWDSSTNGPGTNSALNDDAPLKRALEVPDGEPAGGQYHDPPLFLEQEAERMPPEVQDWIRSLHGGECEVAEFQLNLVGLNNFVEHWQYQRDYIGNIYKF